MNFSSWDGERLLTLQRFGGPPKPCAECGSSRTWPRVKRHGDRRWHRGKDGLMGGEEDWSAAVVCDDCGHVHEDTGVESIPYDCYGQRPLRALEAKAAKLHGVTPLREVAR